MPNDSLYSQPPTPHPPDLRSTYPHFGKGDAEVWEQWLWDHQNEILSVRYDVALGGTIIDDPAIPEAYRRAWQYDTAVKIDALVELADENLVCEVKPHARMGAIGQALGYAMLLQEAPPNDKPIVPCIITLDTSAEVRKIAEALDVRIDVVTL